MRNVNADSCCAGVTTRTSAPSTSAPRASRTAAASTRSGASTSNLIRRPLPPRPAARNAPRSGHGEQVLAARGFEPAAVAGERGAGERRELQDLPHGALHAHVAARERDG